MIKTAQVSLVPWFLGGLTLVALSLRVLGMDQSLFGDELFTYEIATQPSITDILPAIQRTENNPPLFYFLSWAAAQVGDPTLWIRAPSLILGTATIPVVYLLGLRTAGGSAGLIGAALTALSPFALFYSNEGRAYATLIFLVALSTLLLLVALDTQRPGWWFAYGLSASLAVYTHYTGIFPLAAQALWAVWTYRSQVRELVIVHALVALAYLPWLPYLRDQSSTNIELLNGLSKLSPEAISRSVATLLPGYPFTDVSEIPGPFALVLLAVGVCVALGGTAMRFRAARPSSIGLSSRTVLLLLLALVTPLALVVFDIFVPRNLSASLPAAFLLLGTWLSSLPRPVSVAAVSLVTVGLGIGSLKTLDDDFRRTPYEQAAHLIDATGRPDEPVIEIIAGAQSPLGPLGQSLAIHFKGAHRIYYPGVNDEEGWESALDGRRVFLVVPQIHALSGIPRRSGPGARFELKQHRIYPGLIPLGVFQYTRSGVPPRS